MTAAALAAPAAIEAGSSGLRVLREALFQDLATFEIRHELGRRPATKRRAAEPGIPIEARFHVNPVSIGIGALAIAFGWWIATAKIDVATGFIPPFNLYTGPLRQQFLDATEKIATENRRRARGLLVARAIEWIDRKPNDRDLSFNAVPLDVQDPNPEEWIGATRSEYEISSGRWAIRPVIAGEWTPADWSIVRIPRDRGKILFFWNKGAAAALPPGSPWIPPHPPIPPIKPWP